MNILYIEHYAGSLEMGMEFRPYYFAREWEKMGHKVRIIAADFSHVRKQNPVVSSDFELQNIDGIEYQWVKTGRYEGNGVARARTLFEFCSKVYFRAREIVDDFCPDVVISSSTYPLDVYPSLKIKKIRGKKCKYIHEAHDLWPLTLIELAGWSEKHPFIKLLARAEKKAFSRSDAIVAVAAGEADYMISHGMQSYDKFTHIPNGVVLDDWKSEECLPEIHEALLEQLKRENKLIVCYLGGHALSNALDAYLDAAKELRDDDRFAFICVGEGVEKKNLQERVKRESIVNMHMLPGIAKKQVPTLLGRCDALYIGAAPCSLYRYGVSMNKVYDYMMAGKPIIYGVEAKNNDVEEAGCGITVAPGDASEIIEAVLALNNMTQEERARMGNNGRNWVTDNCDYSRLAEKLLEVMK